MPNSFYLFIYFFALQCKQGDHLPHLSDINSLCLRVTAPQLQPSDEIPTICYVLWGEGAGEQQETCVGYCTSSFNPNNLFLILEHNLSSCPVFQDVPANRCLSWAHGEEIRERGERNKLSRCVTIKHRLVFSLTGICFFSHLGPSVVSSHFKAWAAIRCWVK